MVLFGFRLNLGMRRTGEINVNMQNNIVTVPHHLAHRFGEFSQINRNRGKLEKQNDIIVSRLCAVSTGQRLPMLMTVASAMAAAFTLWRF